MADFQAASDRFLQWFKSVGGQFRDDLLQIVDLRPNGAGRGIIATKDIPQDTTLFTIPRDAIINVQTSELSSKLPHVFDGSIDEMDEDAAPLDSWGSLILVLLYEFLRGDASRWKPYFDVLPEQFDTPIFWSEDELKELEGTSLTAEKVGKNESDTMLRQKILPVVFDNAAIFFPGGTPTMSEDDVLRLAHRMGSTIMAYAFDLENEDDEPEEGEDGWVEDREGQVMLGMVPMADTLNANADFNAHVNHGEGLEVTSLRSTLPAGSEILNYYGPLPSSELLRRYGYFTPEHRRYDVVEIPWVLVRTAIQAQLGLADAAVAQVESELDEEELEEVFVIERDSGEPDAEGRLSGSPQVREISAELEEQMKAFLKAVKKLGPDLIPDKRKRDEIAVAVVEKVLTVRLSQYPTTVQEDEALLATPDLPPRKRMAIQVRIGEKLLLQEAIAFANGSANIAPEADGQRASKKARRD
ncbi:SET domain-containing protein RMS1 [Plectosphaerella cucumerina]|uniref:SET domain-containing protein RMS1 n=1 Tax=Plectosphaerella cucumerina TaxID=40658 RepID=A0A8K0TSI1_9PEZI|nr:SET domain-containing protein RMS1 [Plectosphaerella cucumerina]